VYVCVGLYLLSRTLLIRVVRVVCRALAAPRRATTPLVRLVGSALHQPTSIRPPPTDSTLPPSLLTARCPSLGELIRPRDVAHAKDLVFPTEGPSLWGLGVKLKYTLQSWRTVAKALVVGDSKTPVLRQDLKLQRVPGVDVKKDPHPAKEVMPVFCQP
jgi:hypothetical protein